MAGAVGPAAKRRRSSAHPPASDSRATRTGYQQSQQRGTIAGIGSYGTWRTILPSNACPAMDPALHQSMNSTSGGRAVVTLPAPGSSDGMVNTPATAYEATTSRPPPQPESRLPTLTIAQSPAGGVAAAQYQGSVLPGYTQFLRKQHQSYPTFRQLSIPGMPKQATCNNNAMSRRHPTPSSHLIIQPEPEQELAPLQFASTTALLPVESVALGLYSYVGGYVVHPQMVPTTLSTIKIHFNICRDLYSSLLQPTRPQDSKDPLSRPVRTLTAGLRTIRARCASVTPGALESAWPTARDCWPREIYLQCNEYVLELPPNQPIDLTTVVRTGDNRLQVIVNRMSTDHRSFEYALAIEITDVADRSMFERSMTYSAPISSAPMKKGHSASKELGGNLAATSSSTVVHSYHPRSGLAWDGMQDTTSVSYMTPEFVKHGEIIVID